MSGHTPGPWKEGPTEGIGQKGKLIVVDSLGLKVADCEARKVGIKFDRSLQEDTANARLIAKAPELLDRVKELRAALAGAMRVIEGAVIDKADIADCFVDEMKRLGIANGIGQRADNLIADIEGKP